jgi:hypothetical protein
MKVGRALVPQRVDLPKAAAARRLWRKLFTDKAKLAPLINYYRNISHKIIPDGRPSVFEEKEESISKDDHGCAFSSGFGKP